MLFDQVCRHDLATDQVLLNDRFEHRRIACGVPCALGVDDGNGTAVADAQAVGFGAQDSASIGESQFLEPPLQELPRHESSFLVAALGSRLIATQKNVAARDGDADFIGDPPL